MKQPYDRYVAMKKNTVILCRGIPSSGKTYLADQILKEHPNGVVCCADDFFMKDGAYNFDTNKLGAAHSTCQYKFFQAIQQNMSPVIVANTNTTWREVHYYIEAAYLYDYIVYLAEPQTSWAKNVEQCYKRNTHDVPLAAIQRMASRYQTNSHIIGQAKANLGEDLKIYEFSHLHVCN